MAASGTRGGLDFGGINKTGGFTNVVLNIGTGSNILGFSANGMGVASATVNIADCPSGGNIMLVATIVFMTNT